MAEKQSDQAVVVVERDGGLGSFLVGLAVGAGMALLFAPRTGEETREQLKKTGKRLRSAALDAVEDLQDTVSTRYERTRERVEEGLDTAKNVFDEKRDNAREALDAGKAAVKSARSELERRLAESKAARGKKDDAEESDDDV